MKRDIHVLRYFSSFVSVSHGKVIYVSDPALAYCPLAGHLYTGLKDSGGVDKEVLKRKIKETIESKVKEYGFFTAQRRLSGGAIAIAYGASEMLMFALRKKAVDSAVVVCDGAGTVVTDNADLVQGIGARMNTLVLTSPIGEITARLKESGCRVVFEDALIDQAKGVEDAVRAGGKRIAVTVTGHDAETLASIRQIESSSGVSVVILAVCTTGINGNKIDAINRYADVVWSCASADIRAQTGAAALLQISKHIPVFVLTGKGMDFAAAYCDTGDFFSGLDEKKQYLVSVGAGARQARFGGNICSVREAVLPVLPEKSFVMAPAQ